MEPIVYIDRTTSAKKIEKVYGEKWLTRLYGEGCSSSLSRRGLLALAAKSSCFSRLYGLWQKLPWTAARIKPFIAKYDVDVSEFLLPVERFTSFNDFFVRKLKPESRTFDPRDDVAIIPADGRYLFFDNISSCDGFIVKGKKFCLKEFLGNELLAKEYQQGSMVIARLCPSDYHRFHLPCSGTLDEHSLINGYLYSVNPIALKQNIDIFSQNKRTITALQTKHFGKVLYVAVGATNVGSITHTYMPDQYCKKGSEMGYFSFGGSSLVLLFPQGSINFDADLLAATHDGYEIKCLMGQTMGRSSGKAKSK